MRWSAEGLIGFSSWSQWVQWHRRGPPHIVSRRIAPNGLGAPITNFTLRLRLMRSCRYEFMAILTVRWSCYWALSGWFFANNPALGKVSVGSRCSTRFRAVAEFDKSIEGQTSWPSTSRQISYVVRWHGVRVWEAIWYVDLYMDMSTVLSLVWLRICHWQVTTRTMVGSKKIVWAFTQRRPRRFKVARASSSYYHPYYLFWNDVERQH